MGFKIGEYGGKNIKFKSSRCKMPFVLGSCVPWRYLLLLRYTLIKHRTFQLVPSEKLKLVKCFKMLIWISFGNAESGFTPIAVAVFPSSNNERSCFSSILLLPNAALVPGLHFLYQDFR